MSEYERELRRQARRLPQIQQSTLQEILRHLGIARGEVIAALASASPAATISLAKQRAAIEAAMLRFQDRAAGRVVAGADDAWQAGIDLLGKPSAVMGLQLGPVLKINDRALLALREFLTGRIGDVSREGIKLLNDVLAQVVIGTKPMADAITDVQTILGGVTRRRAMTIAYTEIGTVHSAATYASMQAAEAAGVKLAKRWLKSGKRHPRPSHVQAHNQIVRVNEPFLIIDMKTGETEKLRYPRDPKASAGNRINCGCLMVPVLDGSTFGASVIEIPADRTQPVRKVARSTRAESTQALVARVNSRLATLGTLTAPLTVITSANAVSPLVQARDLDLTTQIALWIARPIGRASLGPVATPVARAMAVRDADVKILSRTARKQATSHADIPAQFYADLPLLLGGGYQVIVREPDGSAVMVAKWRGQLYQIVLRRDGKGALVFRSAYLLNRANRIAKLKLLPVIDGVW